MAGAQLHDDPRGEQCHRGCRAGQAGGTGPSPVRALGEQQQQRRDPEPEHDGAADVGVRRAFRARRQHGRGGGQAQRAERGDEPERRAQAQVLGQQPDQRVADADPHGGGDPDPRDRRPGVPRGQVVPRYGSGQRHQPEPGTLQRPPGQEQSEASRQGGQHAAGQHHRHGADRDRAAPPAVAEPSQQRGRDRPGQQRDGERPLRRSEGDVVGLLDGCQQRRAEAGHRGRLHGEEQQHRDQHGRTVPFRGGLAGSSPRSQAPHRDQRRNPRLMLSKTKQGMYLSLWGMNEAPWT
jgi:hypothetical protein